MQLSKKDMILARKTYEANKLKMESKYGARAVTAALDSRRSGGGRPGTTAGSLSRLSGKTFPQNITKYLEKSNSASALILKDALANTSKTGYRPNTAMNFTSPIAEKSRKAGREDEEVNPHVTRQDDLIEELSERGMTNKMKLAKQQLSVATKVLNEHGEVDFDDPEQLEEALQQQDFYMPKKTLYRPDGASLLDVYRSKQDDFWAKILMTQLKEENKRKIVEREQKIELDAKYGRDLREQLRANEERAANQDNTDEKLAALVEATSKAADDVQKARKEDAIRRHKEFISNALEDIETKRINREIELNKELEAAIKTNNRVKALIAADEKKKEEFKIQEGLRLERLWKENQENLKRKADIKYRDGQENLRIFKIGEEKYRKEDERRAADLASKMRMSSDGPAHAVAREVMRRHNDKVNSFYTKNMSYNNSLMTQLEASEEFSKNRMKGKALDLNKEKALREAYLKKQKEEEDERLRKIIEFNRKKMKQMEEEDRKARQKKRDAAMTYQRELDKQLNASRNKSFASMRETMSVEEKKMNMRMLRELGLADQ